jgi:hypothetical protein
MLFKSILILLSTSLVACGSADAKSLRGTWGNSDMTAHVYKNSIQIDLIVDSEESVLYWKGTFRSSLSDGESFRSKPDTKALDASFFGSTAKSKKFTYKNNRLIFQFSILGRTMKVFLKQR